MEAMLESLHVCRDTPGREPVTFIRPSGAPGLETDARYALDVARLEQEARATKQAAKQHNADMAALAALALLHSVPPPPPIVLTPIAPAFVPPVRIAPIRCESTLVGTSVYTTCR